MAKLTQSELRSILEKHAAWVMSKEYKKRPVGECARLHDADLSNLTIESARLQQAHLPRANLQGANLRGTSFLGANLKGANLQGANLQDTYFRDADLRGAQLDVGFRDCFGFWGAQFTADALPWLILHPKWSEVKGTVQIEGV